MNQKALVFDIGTTRIKGGIVNLDSLQIEKTHSVKSIIEYPGPGKAEQDPETLWNTLKEISKTLVEDPSEIKALVFVAYMAGLILLDENGEPLTKLITWLDERAAGLPRDVWSGPLKISGFNLFKLIEFLRITGGAPSNTGKDVISKIVWLKENMPDTYRDAKYILGATGYLVFKATGEPVYPADDAHLTWLADTRKPEAEWSDKLLKRYGISKDKLPPIKHATEIAGILTDEAASDLGLEKDTKVLVGMGDVAATALGSGAILENKLHIYLGTSGWTAFHTRKRVLDISHYIGSLISAQPGYYLAIAEQEIAGGALDWASKILGYESVGDALASAERVKPGSEGLLFAPWLFGERCPIDDPYARGVLLGFSMDTDNEAIIRSVLEGVIINTAWGFIYSSKLAKSQNDPVRLVGGLARSMLAAQILADTIGRRIELVEKPELAGIRGGGMVAGYGLGIRSMEEYVSRIPIAETFTPGNNREVYSELFQIYLETYKSVKKLFRELGRLRGH